MSGAVKNAERDKGISLILLHDDTTRNLYYYS